MQQSHSCLDSLFGYLGFWLMRMGILTVGFERCWSYGWAYHRWPSCWSRILIVVLDSWKL